MLSATPDEISSEYGVTAEEAALSLRCYELASLPAWDHASMLDAATAQSLSEEQRLLWGFESRDALARRIALAMRAEGAPELLHPIDGVLLLERCGIHVFHELREAVKYRPIATDADTRRLRMLVGAVEPSKPPAVQQEERRRARGYFTVEEAAQALGEQEGMHGGARQTLLARMMEAARDGNLTVRDPHTDLPFRPAEVHGYYELVTPADVNAWLAGCGVGYRWSVPTVEAEPAPNEARAAGEPERRAFTHRLQGRRDDLTPAIDAAIARVSDPTDFAAVWGAFLALADSPEPMPPLLGVAEGEVKYRTAHRVKCITRDAFIKRLKYAANKRG